MTCFVLIPGAGGSAWYWHRVVPLLVAAGHEALAVELPADRPGASLAGCTDAVLDAIGPRPSVILVAQSMGAYTASDVALRTAVELIVLVNPMTPAPGESPGQWWAATGQPAAKAELDRRDGRPTEFDVATVFLHDVPPDVAAAGAEHERAPADSMFAEPPAMTAWPAVPTVQITGRDDRFFPLDFQRRLAHERLGIEPAVIPGGHLVALSQPELLTARLLAHDPGAI